MNIAVPIAAYEEGTTGEYVARALKHIGHEAKTLSQYEFYDAFKADAYDLYFCVDSGGPLNLFESSIAQLPMHKICFWMIDYRRGKTLKNPNDEKTCRLLDMMGGWTFQAQLEDVIDCMNVGIRNVSWLPLGADTDIWTNQPPAEKVYDIGFAGNVWDGTRHAVLEELGRRYGTRLGFHGHGAARMEVGAHLLRASRLGFNISSFYGEPIAYDVNMRVFETLACGIPLVTNWVPSLVNLGLHDAPFVRTYRNIPELYQVLEDALKDDTFLNSGDAAREYAERSGTYKLRMQMAILSVQSKILKPKWEQE